MSEPRLTDAKLTRLFVDPCAGMGRSQVRTLIKEVRAIRAAHAKLREAARNLKAKCYLDDNVINRHPFTTVSCEALKELFAALAESDPQ